MKNRVIKTIYYQDELNDEFSEAVLAPRKIDGTYKYVDDRLIKKFTHFFWYRVVAIPMAWIYLKLKFSHKIVGRKVLKAYKKHGFYLFGNHTQAIADALIPTMVSHPKTVYVIVHPSNVSMPVLGKITPSLGALPLPDDKDAAKNFIKAVERRTNEGKVISIYPEAHIWPFYTGIRPFSDKSFRYPVKYDKPVFCFTNTYQAKKPGGRVKMVTYVDGPFFPDKSLTPEQRKKQLRDKVYENMCERAKSSNAVIIQYEERKKDD